MRLNVKYFFECRLSPFIHSGINANPVYFFEQKNIQSLFLVSLSNCIIISLVIIIYK